MYPNFSKPVDCRYLRKIKTFDSTAAAYIIGMTVSNYTSGVLAIDLSYYSHLIFSVLVCKY